MNVKIPHKISAAEKKAMTKEIHKQIAESRKHYEKQINELVLWSVMNKFQCSKKKLKQFYMDFESSLNELLSHYEMSDEDLPWMCEVQLQRIGIDVDEWQKEFEANHGRDKDLSSM